MPSVIIIGATSAIARAVAGEFAAHQYDLVLAGRDGEELSALAADLSLRYTIRATTQPFNALEYQAHDAFWRGCVSEAGEGLEGVVMCVGHLGDHAKALTDRQEARRILETNFTGCISVLNLVAGYFEKKGKGFICVLSSVAGDRGRQSNYLYGAAKGGLSIFLQGLRNRLFHAGVRVITAKPGFVDTRMTFGRSGLLLLASPETVGRGIYNAVAREQDVVYLPGFWRFIMLAVRAIPERLFKRLRT